jgi:hypothetical protein
MWITRGSFRLLRGRQREGGKCESRESSGGTASTQVRSDDLLNHGFCKIIGQNLSDLGTSWS